MRANGLFICFLVLIIAAAGVAQKPSPPTDTAAGGLIRSSAAYAELLLHKADLDSDLDALLVDYTEDYPKVKDIRLELSFLKTEMDRLLAIKPADVTKLSQALGKLMLRKVSLETQLDTLRTQYKDDHPDVRKARKKVETYEAAIKEILG
jgi:hypothetical protein